MYIRHNIILKYPISHHPRRLFETGAYKFRLTPTPGLYLKQAVI